MDNMKPGEKPVTEKDLNNESGNAHSSVGKKGYLFKCKDGLTLSVVVAGIIIIVVISSLFGAVFGFMAGGAANIFSEKIEKKIIKYFPSITDKKTTPEERKQQVIVEDSAVIDVVEKASPAVVSIIISKNLPNLSNDYFGFFDPFFGGDPFYNSPQEDEDGGTTKREVGGGSGFFITSDGLILTNKHVVEDKNASYTVVTNDGKKYDAKVLARDPARDIAVIKVEGNNFPILTLGDSDSLKIGQTTVAIGNALGEFINSVSRGIVSGLKRNVEAGSGFGKTERLTDIIQTDAAINSGNSGGPLLNIQGEVIGINVAMAQGAQNVGFALPINQASRIIEEAKGGAKVSVPFIGVRYVMIDDSVKAEAQLPFNYGVLVLRGNKMTELAVIPGSPADKAGIVENDIILEVDGKKIDENNQLSDAISKHNVGDEITLKIWHKGSTKEIKLKLEENKN